MSASRQPLNYDQFMQVYRSKEDDRSSHFSRKSGKEKKERNCTVKVCFVSYLHLLVSFFVWCWQHIFI